MTTSEPMTERESMIQIYSDFHKDAYGFRPRGINYHEFSLAELKADFQRFESICKENRRAQEEAEKRASEEFEARVESVINMGAGDRKTALRWILDSYDEDDFWYGVDFFVSCEMHMGYGEYSKQLANELEPLIVERMNNAA